MILLSKQELAPFFGEQNRLSRRLRACPSVFLDKQSIKERYEYKKVLSFYRSSLTFVDFKTIAFTSFTSNKLVA